MPSSTPVQVRLHATALVRGRDGAADVGIDRKQAALIAWLAAHGATARSRLAGLLWPDVSEARARGNLRQSLSKLHRISGATIVESQGPMLALAAGVAVQAAEPGTRWLEAFHYDDCSRIADWLAADDESRRNQRRRTLLADVRTSAQNGELDHALEQADALLALERESEEAYRVLMEVFYLRGDRAAAIDVWDRCRTMLRSLYGVAPSPETQRLGQTILDSDAAPASLPTAIPVTVLRPPRFIGREGIVTTLAAAWRMGDAICVSGEGGLGKSRLLGEFVGAVGPSAVASARPGDAVLPYASLARLVLSAIERFEPASDTATIDAVVQLLPPIAATFDAGEPAPLRTAHERARALDALAQLLGDCVARGCSAFVFDDLQFADRESVEALQALIERAAPAAEPLPARLAFGSRDDELAPFARALLDSLHSTRRLVRVALTPLAPGEVVELLHSLGLPGFDAGRQAARLRRRVGGNPAFLLESIKLVAALGRLGDTEHALPIPPGVEAVVERRIALLSPAARHIAELAAVAGESFNVDLAGRAMARSLAELAEPLRELEMRQVLYGRQFVHDIVASAVRRAVSATVAERLHRFVAEQLELAGGEPAVIAGHWQSSGEWQRAGVCWMNAAAHARRNMRPAQLAATLDAAAEAFGRSGDQALRFEALQQRLQVTTAPDFMATRIAQLERMQAEAQGETQSLQVLLAEVSAHADHLRADSIVLAERGVARALAAGAPKMALRFAQAAAWQYAVKGDPAPGLALIEAHREWAFRQDDLSERVLFHTARSGVLGLTDRLGDAIDETEQALALLRVTDDPLPMLPLLSNLGLMRSWRGEFEAARAVLSEAALLRDRLHGKGTGALIDVNLGAALRDLGRYDEALSLLESANAEYRRQLATDGERTDLVVVENHLAQLWLMLGRTDLAEQAFASDAASTEMRFRLRRATLRARAARIAGQRDERVRDDLDAAISASPISLNRALAEFERARLQSAERVLEALDPWRASPVLIERPGVLMHALTLMADAARATGDDTRARLHVDRLLELDAHYRPFDLDPLEAWRVAHAVLATLGDATARDGAARVARRAIAWLRTLEAATLAARSATLVASSGYVARGLAEWQVLL